MIQAWFAEVDSMSEHTLTGWTILMAVVTTASALGTAIISYLSGRDKLRFDVEIKTLREDFKKCDEDRDLFRKLADEAKSVADMAEVKLAKLEGQMEAIQRESSRLREEVRELRDRLYGGQAK